MITVRIKAADGTVTSVKREHSMRILAERTAELLAIHDDIKKRGLKQNDMTYSTRYGEIRVVIHEGPVSVTTISPTTGHYVRTQSVREQIIGHLEAEPKTAVELIDTIAVGQTGEQRRRTYAAVYRVLSSLTRAGQVATSVNTDGRKVYALVS